MPLPVAFDIIQDHFSKELLSPLAERLTWLPLAFSSLRVVNIQKAGLVRFSWKLAEEERSRGENQKMQFCRYATG